MPGLLLDASDSKIKKSPKNSSDWCFSFRGGLESDSSDSEDGVNDNRQENESVSVLKAPSDIEPVESADSKLLKELDIGSRADNDMAQFKSNPWSIARVNAAARNTAKGINHNDTTGTNAPISVSTKSRSKVQASYDGKLEAALKMNVSLSENALGKSLSVDHNNLTARNLSPSAKVDNCSIIDCSPIDQTHTNYAICGNDITSKRGINTSSDCYPSSPRIELPRTQIFTDPRVHQQGSKNSSSSSTRVGLRQNHLGAPLSSPLHSSVTTRNLSRKPGFGTNVKSVKSSKVGVTLEPPLGNGFRQSLAQRPVFWKRGPTQTHAFSSPLRNTGSNCASFVQNSVYLGRTTQGLSSAADVQAMLQVAKFTPSITHEPGSPKQTNDLSKVYMYAHDPQAYSTAGLSNGLDETVIGQNAEVETQCIASHCNNPAENLMPMILQPSVYSKYLKQYEQIAALHESRRLESDAHENGISPLDLCTTVDAYRFGSDDEDATWSTLSSRKKAHMKNSVKSEHKPKDFKQSGRFKLPSVLPHSISVDQAKLSNREKPRVITYLPPQNCALLDCAASSGNKLSSDSAQSNRELTVRPVAKWSIKRFKFNNEANIQRKDTDKSLQPIQQNTEDDGAKRTGCSNVKDAHEQCGSDDSDATLAGAGSESLYKAYYDQSSDRSLEFNSEAVMKNYAEVREAIINEKAAVREAWDLLGLPSCGTVFNQSDKSEDHDSIVGGNVVYGEMPIVMWKGPSENAFESS